MIGTAPASPASFQTEPSYDYSAWPIFVTTLPPMTLSDAGLVGHLARRTEAHKRGTPFCMLIDISGQPSVPANQRKMIAASIDQDARKYPNLLVASAVVTPLAFGRGVVTAIHWVPPPPHPIGTFASRTEAMDWLWKVMATKG